MSAPPMLDARVVGRSDLTPRVVSIELEPVGRSEFPGFTAGAHVDVRLVGTDGVGPLVRQYSLCGSPADPKRYRLAVLREEASRGGSAAIHRVAIDDHVQISAPRNHFPLVAASRYALFAGGIGITPIYAMVQELDARGGDYVLHYSARSRNDAAFLPELSGDPRVVFHIDDEGPGNVLDLARDLGAPTGDAAVYVCGPGPYIDFVLRGATELGWPQQSLHKERFAPSERPPAGSSDSFRVRVASTGAEYEVSGETSVLEVLRENGVEVDSSCEQGICGDCVVRVLAGDPDHRDDVLTDAERAEGQFTTCSSRSFSPILAVDL